MLDGKTQQITHQTGTIISHRGYPQEYYPINMDSQLKIRVTGVLFLSLEVNQFNLEKRYSTGCYDYLQITDNTGNRQYCGNEISIGKSSRVVPNGQISFRFKTDSHTENFGFRLQFKYYGKIILYYITSIVMMWGKESHFSRLHQSTVSLGIYMIHIHVLYKTHLTKMEGSVSTITCMLCGNH